MSNALLASDEDHIEVDAPSLCLSGDMKRGYSTTPIAHLRDLQEDGLSATAQRVYVAIAQRQISLKGQCFRSNAGLGEELGVHRNTISRSIAQLRAKNYLTIWYINGGRRMRVLTPMSRGVSAEVKGGKRPCVPDKENNIKKTTQPKVCVFSKKHLSLFGERVIENLVATYDSDRVMRGLQVFDQQKDGTVRNNVAWLTKAIKDDFEPSNKADRFPECPFSQTKIIDSYLAENPDKSVTIRDMIEKGLSEGRIAYKIWAGKV